MRRAPGAGRMPRRRDSSRRGVVKDVSRRQKLLRLAESGRLRDVLNRGNVGADVEDLVVDLCLRYCERR